MQSISPPVQAMLNTLFPLLYGTALIVLLWWAFRVMTQGFHAANSTRSPSDHSRGDRTGRLTIHPELLDQEGRITEEELLTVRFSGDNEPPEPTDTSTE